MAPGVFSKIMDAATVKKFDVLIVESLDRVSRGPAAQERYLSVVENLAAESRGGKPQARTGEAVRDLIGSVVVERTKPWTNRSG